MDNQTDNVTGTRPLYNRSHTTNEVIATSNSAPASWNFIAVFTLSLCPLVILLNSAILLCFLKDESLRKQPFSVYLMWLLCSNILYAVLENPLEILDHVGSVWSYGVAWCITYKYALLCVFNSQMYAHVLITISRLWAMTFPHSYRQLHTRKCAILFCVALVAYAHVVHFPTILANIMYIKQPLEIHGCLAQYGPTTYEQFMVTVAGLAFVIAAYPFILWMRRKRMQSRNQVGYTISTMDKTTKTLPPREIVLVVPAVPKPPRERSSQALLVVTLLTCSITIFWAPCIILYTVASFMPVPYPLLFQVVITLLAVQPLMDPILFTVAMKDLRNKFQVIFCCGIS